MDFTWTRHRKLTVNLIIVCSGQMRSRWNEIKSFFFLEKWRVQEIPTSFTLISMRWQMNYVVFNAHFLCYLQFDVVADRSVKIRFETKILRIDFCINVFPWNHNSDSLAQLCLVFFHNFHINPFISIESNVTFRKQKILRHLITQKCFERLFTSIRQRETF